MSCAIALFAGACSHGKGPIEVVAGQRFPINAAANLSRGTSADEIRKLFGEPLAVTRNGDAEIWKYAYETEQQEDIKLLWVLPIPSAQHRRRSTVTLTLRNSQLAEKVLEPWH